MRYLRTDIRLQEVPGEISLAFHMTGCQLRCNGCQSPQVWDAQRGELLNDAMMLKELSKYRGLVTCALFMGGEHDQESLLQLLSVASDTGIKTALYTGVELEQLKGEIVSKLTYVKTGPWRSELGGLNSHNTNQRFLNLTTGEDLTLTFFDRDHVRQVNPRTTEGQSGLPRPLPSSS